MPEYVLQLIGFIGLAFFVVSYQIKSNRALFLCQTIGCVIFLVQMCLLGALTGALTMPVNILRNLLLLKINDWKWVKSKLTLAVVLALLAVITIYTWAGWLSLLPCASISITCVGYWTNDARKIRISQLFGSPCTLLYDVLVRSWGGALSETMTLVSIIVSIFRFGLHNKPHGKASL